MKHRTLRTPGLFRRFGRPITTVIALAWALAGPGQGAYLSPSALVASPAGDALYIVASTGRQIVVVDTTAAKVKRQIPLADSPSGIALAPNGQTLYVTAGLPHGTVQVIDSVTGAIRARISAGYSPVAPVISADGRTLFVCDRFRSRLLAVDLIAMKTKAETPIGREPLSAVLSSDGGFLLVACLLPQGSATGPVVSAEVVMVKTADLTVAARIALPNGSTSVRGICLAPDGRYAYVVHTLAHYQLPTTQLDRGWMNTSALSVIDVAARRWVNTVLLDAVDQGAANPWDVAGTRDGQWLCVSHSGTHEVSVIDRQALHRKLNQVAAGPSAANLLPGATDVPSDLSFLLDLRRRVRLPGNGPRGLAIVGRTLYAAEYFSDSLAVVGLEADAAGRSRSIPLGPAPHPTEARRGEMLFHDAKLCFQQWQSCASCHPDARVDALNWDLLNDGPGTPKNTRSLLWSHRTPPAMSLGIRDTAETAVRAGLRHIQFVVRPEADALAMDAYLKSLEPLPSPFLADPQIATRARTGRQVFEKAGCGVCHPPPLYTSLKAYDVGTGTARETGAAFDTPTLVELWRTAPYLHDGRAATIEEVLTRSNPGDRHGRTSNLSPAERDDLAAFLLTL
jgi:DNA-binding beta-propeller fold protein YncE